MSRGCLRRDAAAASPPTACWASQPLLPGTPALLHPLQRLLLLLLRRRYCDVAFAALQLAARGAPTAPQALHVHRSCCHNSPLPSLTFLANPISIHDKELYITNDQTFNTIQSHKESNHIEHIMISNHCNTSKKTYYIREEYLGDVQTLAQAPTAGPCRSSSFIVKTTKTHQEE